MPSFEHEKLNNSDDQLEEKSYEYLVSGKTCNITESVLRYQYPGLLDILLMDRTTKKNIIWYVLILVDLEKKALASIKESIK